MILNHYTLREQRNEQTPTITRHTKPYIFYTELDMVMKFSEKYILTFFNKISVSKKGGGAVLSRILTLLL